LKSVKLDFRGKKKRELLSVFQESALEVCRGMKEGESCSLGAPFHAAIYKVNSKDSYVQPTGRFQSITQEGIAREMSRLLSEANKKFSSKGEAMGVVAFQWPYRGDLRGLGMGDVIGCAFDSINVTTYTDTDEVYVCAEGLAHLYFDVMQIYPARSNVTTVKVEEGA
jgi:hypothetical protein